MSNEPKITELIEAPDAIEAVRDQIAALLSLELQNQYAMAREKGVPNAADYNIKIYVENARPYDTVGNTRLSLVNVVLPEITVPHSNPRIGDQKEQAVFHIYCIADGNNTGDFRDDKSATFRAWKIMRLVRRIIMSDMYTYLGLRKTVTSRIITKMEVGTPAAQTATFITAVRAHLEVQFKEGSIESPFVPLEGYDFDVSPEDGEVKAKPSLKDRVTGIANNNEEDDDVTSIGN